MQEKYDIYKELLSQELRMSYIFFSVFCILLLSAILALIYWMHLLNEEKKRHKKGKKKADKEQKRQKALWIVVLVIVCGVAMIGIPSQIMSISNLRHDIENNAFIIYDQEITISSRRIVGGSGAAHTEYYFSFHDGEDLIKERVSKTMIQEHSLSDGIWDDLIVVYGEKSHEIVDVYGK